MFWHPCPKRQTWRISSGVLHIPKNDCKTSALPSPSRIHHGWREGRHGSLALAMMQDDLGRDVALDIARRLVLFLKS
jgi:hypothetical protein